MRFDGLLPAFMTGSPAMQTIPDVGGMMPAMMRPSVDLPQPDSPTSPNTSPLSIPSDNLSTACTERVSTALPNTAAIRSPTESDGVNSFDTSSILTKELTRQPPLAADDDSGKPA